MKPSSRGSSRRRQRGILQWLAAGLLLAAAIFWGTRALRSGGGTGGSAGAISRLRTADFHSLVFSAVEPDTVFFGHHGGLLLSTDGGREWRAASLRNADAMALAAPPGDSEVMYAAGHNVLMKSTDAGGSWQSIDADLPGLDIHGFAGDPENPDLLYAHVVGFGVFRSRDGGDHWELLTSQAVFLNLAVGETSETLYGAAAQSGLFRSDDGGRTWSRLPGPPGEGVVAVAFDRNSGQLYATSLGAGAGVYASNDLGLTWASLNLRGTILAIAVSPHDPDRLIAVDGSGWVYASRDGGASWAESPG